MEDIRKAKSEYRKAIRAKLEATTEEYRSAASAKIAVNALAIPEMRKAKEVLVYYSVGTEPGTLALISKLLESGKRVCLPLCTDVGGDGKPGPADATDVMEARLIKSFDDLQPGAYGIPEPKEDTKLIPPEKIDLIILPCLACDTHCNRIGHGAGYYDKYLKRVKRKCFTMALCYEEVMADALPVEAHDVPVHAVVTEKQIYRWRPKTGNKKMLSEINKRGNKWLKRKRK